MLTHNSRLQFITHYTEKYSYVDSARIALEGGCRWIQLRMKDADASTLEETALIVQRMCKDYGATFIIGGTVNSLEDVRATLQSATPDYFGCGPFRFTSTKKNLAPILGREGYRNILQGMKEAGIHIPLVAIGGIGKEDIPELLESGVHGIALSGSILRAENPVEEMKEIIKRLSMNQP